MALADFPKPRQPTEIISMKFRTTHIVVRATFAQQQMVKVASPYVRDKHVRVGTGEECIRAAD